MKNHGFLLMFWMGLLIPVKAQITITNAVFPAVGDTLFYAADTQPDDIVMTPPGGGQQWDFSHLRPMLTWEVIFRDAQGGADYSAFPTASLFYESVPGSVENYLAVSAQEVTLLGVSGADPLGLGIELISKYNPPIVLSRAPVNFFDIKQTSSGLLTPFDNTLLPPDILNILPFLADSFRIRIAVNRLDVVDAWGSLTIPGGTFDVLREKRTQYTESRLDAKIPPLGWLDVTDIFVQSIGLTTLGVDTLVTYQFLNDQSKEPIAICTTDNTQLRVISVQYKNLDISTGITSPERTNVNLAVFPNPAEEVLQIRAGNLPAGEGTLFVYTILGTEVVRQTCEVIDHRLEAKLAIAHLEKGVYVCKFSNGGRSIAQAIFVKQ